MKHRILVFYDKDVDYIEKLTSYLQRNGEPGFEIQGFADVSRLKEFCEKRQPDILAVPDGMPDEEWMANARTVYILSEERTSQSDDANTIYKYQSSRKIYRQITAAFRRKEERPDDGSKRGCALIGIYSPVGRCYKTTFALTLGLIAAHGVPVLYISFEECSALPVAREEMPERTLSDIIYSRRVGMTDWNGVRRAVGVMGMLSYISPAACPSDIRTADMGELVCLVKDILNSGEYRLVIADLGNALADPTELMRLCGTIFMPTLGDGASKAKTKAYMEYIESMDTHMARKTHVITLPYCRQIAEGGILARQLPHTSFGSFVSQMVMGKEKSWISAQG